MTIRLRTYYLLLLLMPFAAMAQGQYTNCDKIFFGHSKKVSTSICRNKEGTKGMATAYDAQGKKIYEREVRRIYGVASVEFTYYDNGAVKNAHYHTAPDAGIQWYNTYTHFAPDGTVTGEEHNDYDQRVTISPQLTKPPVTEPKKEKQTVAICAVPFLTEYWYINNTKHAVVVIAERKGYTKDTKATVVQPSDTVKGGEFIMAEQFVNLADYYTYSAMPVSKRVKKKFALTLVPHTPAMDSKERRKCYYVVR